MSRNPHKVLGIEPGASPDEIRRAYLRMVKKYHPDAGGDAWVFSEIQAAYDALTKDQGTAKHQSARGTQSTQDQANKQAASSAKKAEAEKAETHRADRHSPPPPPPPPPPQPQASSPNPKTGQGTSSNPSPHEFTFRPSGTGRRPRRRRSALGNLIGAVLGGLMVIIPGWYVLKTRPDLIAFLWSPAPSPATEPGTGPGQSPGGSTISPQPPTSATSADPKSGTSKQNPAASSSPSPKAPSVAQSERSGNARSPLSAEPNKPSAASGVPNQPTSDPRSPTNSTKTGRSPDLGNGISAQRENSASRRSDVSPPAASWDPAQPTGVEALDRDIVAFDRRLAAAQAEPTELKRQKKLDESVAWMQAECKRARVRIKFRITDIRAGDAELYLVHLGPPDPGEYPRMMSYPKVAEMKLTESDALRIGDNFRLEVSGFTGFHWGQLDPAKAIVFYASECPLAPQQLGLPYGPNFGAFPTDYVYQGQDSLRPSYWIILDEAKLRIVKAQE